jgi:hypothetical protein
VQTVQTVSGVSETLMSEEAEAYFVLTLREAIAPHFARRNTRSTNTGRWVVPLAGDSNGHDAHSTGIADILSANFRVSNLTASSTIQKNKNKTK